MTANQSRISIQVRPGAPRNEVVSLKEGIWHIKIAAPPVEGKANREIVSFLSDLLGVSRSRITIAGGLTSRRKVVVIEGLTAAEITQRLST